jgi:hypothetical protein
MLWTSSTDPTGTPGTELLVMKWSSLTAAHALVLRATVLDLLRGLSKMTSPEFPGWSVQWTLYSSAGAGTTSRLVLWVEPDGLPF